jgi:hypothetical protein
MPKSHFMRMRLLGSAAVIGLFGAMAGSAQAVETQFGELNITFDTTISMGASVRTAERDDHFLPEGNGGPVDPRGSGVIFQNTVGASSLANPAVKGNLTLTANKDNFDGSVNSDDGRLNFDAGDWIGGNVKANHDLVVTWRNYTVFARAVGFYDIIQNDADAGRRSLITDDARGDVGRNYNLLDAFVSADYTFAGMPLNLRAGKQVINWGESTFILGGNNVFNPIDVSSFRRPGSEIKEAFLPVNALYGSITLPEELLNISLAGYYALDWEPFQLDPGGTAFAQSDSAAFGSGFGGNRNASSFLSGSPYSGYRLNCTGVGTNIPLTTVVGLGLIKNPNTVDATRVDCGDSSFINYNTPYTIGQHEQVKFGLADSFSGQGLTEQQQGVVDHDPDRLKHDNGDFGLSARYLADWLGGTEFGFYYQNYTSRLPFVGEHAGRMELGMATTGDSTQISGIAGRFAMPTGCVGITANPGTFLDPRLGTGPGTLGRVLISDPQNLISANAVGQNLNTLEAIFQGANPGAGQGPGGAYITDSGGGTLAAPVTGNFDTVRNQALLNCGLALFESGLVNVPGVGIRPEMFNGTETFNGASDISFFLEYPEDIDVFGASFATTVLGWGVQGDFTYRPRAPFQIDTDSMTIGAAASECAFPAGVSDLAMAPIVHGFEELNTYAGTDCNPLAVGNRDLSGEIYSKMFQANIGTTATFTASDWWVDGLGADLGIFVTEFGYVHVDGVEDTWIDNNTAVGANHGNQQFQNIGCQGSDLPLGGLLGLDHKSSQQCRPTDDSAGMVLLYSMQYNNAFGSGFVVSPTIVYTWDYYGTTPAPYGNFIEDRMAVNLGVTGTLNNNFKIGVNYSNFFGGHIVNKARDTDFASGSVSYSF